MRVVKHEGFCYMPHGEVTSGKCREQIMMLERCWSHFGAWMGVFNLSSDTLPGNCVAVSLPGCKSSR